MQRMGMRRGRLLLTLFAAVCVITMFNILYMKPSSLSPYESASTSIRDGSRGVSKGFPHRTTVKKGHADDAEDVHGGGGGNHKNHSKGSSSGGKKHRKKGAHHGGIHQAWEHSVALQHESHALVQQSGDAFLTLFDSFHSDDGKAKKSHNELDQSCGYMHSVRHHRLRKMDYSHRVKRKGELSTMAMYREIKRLKDSNSDFFFEFGHVLPVTLNQFPVQLSSDFDLSEPFGSWNTQFFPVVRSNSHLGHDVLRHHDDQRPQPSTTDDETYPDMNLTLVKYRPPQLLETQPPAYVAMFHNAVVSHGHVVTCGGEVLSAGGCLWDFHLPQIDSTKDVHHERVAVSLCDEWCKGYYHFTHEHLPRVAVVHRLLLERNDSMLVLSHSPNGFQRQLLTDVLGIPASQIIHGKAVLGDTVVYPMPMRCGNTFTTMLYLLRRIVYDRLDLGEGPTLTHSGDGSSSISPGKLRLLFAERKHLSRMPTNYDELKQRLVKQFADDFEFESTSGDTNAKRQILMFHRADVVIGPHGANLANMMWMRHGTHVIEIASRRKGNMCYYATASRINVTHHLVLHDKGKDAKFTLSYDYLERHVEFAIRRLRSDAAAADAHQSNRR